jgi:ABC-2 type transport system ATP-binding protein
LLAANEGEVRLRGEVFTPADRSLRHLIGIVPQELAIYGELTARENLRFFGELYGIRGGELSKRVDEVLGLVGLADRADHRADTFSGGMQRRLNLGAALVHQPPLLLLDEPTVGVDPQSRNHLFEEVRRLNAAGVTIVYTSHYMEEVQTLCRRVGIIDHGEVIACDTLPNLLRLARGVIRIDADPVTSALRERLASLPEVQLLGTEDGRLELECREVKSALLRVMGVLNEFKVTLHSLETEEPNLERVFFDLTHKALRD